MSKQNSAAQSRGNDKQPAEHGRASRETIESIAVAIILAFLFRGFVAEAFVIPTGSMAPTLQGRHMDVVCSECGYQYRTGASIENTTGHQQPTIVETTCPICRFHMTLDKENDPNQRSFNGDRILVSKFAYEFGDPSRWDVIVFKYPGNAKQNYIKRLVGLPNEELLIRHGDIYTRPLKNSDGQESGWRIQRKPPYKLIAMQQLVDDTKYRPERLMETGWPSRWQDWRNPDSTQRTKFGETGADLNGLAEGGGRSLRYRHIVPRLRDWIEIDNAPDFRSREDDPQIGALICDYYPYNDGVSGFPDSIRGRRGVAELGGYEENASTLGMHWVGDLAFLADVEVKTEAGTIWLELVEGGVKYRCNIDVATGKAELLIDDGARPFTDDQGKALPNPTASTSVNGPGKYRLRFSNCDDQLLLWVNDRSVSFDSATTYTSDGDVSPKWSAEDPADLEPIGIGVERAELSVSRLRVYRDVYYVAISSQFQTGEEYNSNYNAEEIREIMESPVLWSKSSLFGDRRQVEFELRADQFFPLGDNSPASKDGRLWAPRRYWSARNDQELLTADAIRPPPYVDRKLLIGKALMIYWPHSWRRPIPFFPNFERIGLIK